MPACSALTLTIDASSDFFVCQQNEEARGVAVRARQRQSAALAAYKLRTSLQRTRRPIGIVLIPKLANDD
jgi:hypothetical protein